MENFIHCALHKADLKPQFVIFSSIWWQESELQTKLQRNNDLIPVCEFLTATLGPLSSTREEYQPPL